MNNRELGLQNIIKSQQSKIAQLKQQLKLVSDISQNRYSDVEKHHMQQLKQKDQMIEYFKNQLANQKKNKLEQKSLNNNYYIRAKENVQDQLTKFKDKNQELQSKIKQLQLKLQTNVEDYQLKLKKVYLQNKKLNQEANQYIKGKGMILVQIQKISKFYKAAMFQLPKRKETLVWVDNLIKFMQHSQSSFSQNHNQLYSFMKNTITEMSKDLINSISQIAIIEQNINKDKDEINQNMKKIIDWSSNEQQKIKNQFQQIAKIFKIEKENKEKEELFQCKTTLKNLQIKYQNQIQDINQKIKEFQIEKKTLIMALQQVKNYYENKQQTYKEQISYLKQTVTDLLDSARHRQKQFQDQINVLSSQIQSISQRYYQNIQFPIIKVNQKVSVEIQKVKSQLTKFNENLLQKKTLEKLSENIPHYIQRLDKQALNNQNIQIYLEKGTQLLTNAMTLVYEASTSNLQKIKQDQLKIYQKQKNEQILQLQKSVRQIQWKQRQSKYIYQINVLKKHNQRLNQLSSNLQKKLKTSKIGTELKDEKLVQSYLNNERKYVNSQIEIESLTKLNKQYQTLLKSQLQKIYKKIQEVKDKKIKKDNVYHEIKQSLKKLQSSHITVMQMIKSQNIQNFQIKKNLNSINDILIKPTEAIQSLVKQISNIAIKTHNTNQPLSEVRKSFNSTIKINQYKQIMTKRQQLNQITTRTISELIKTIKDNFSMGKDKQIKKKQIQLGFQKQKQQVKSYKSNTQKKIKQLQSTQNRYRQQISHGILKIQKQVQVLQQKYVKKSKVNQSKKVEIILQQKIKTLMEELNFRQKNQQNQFGDITSEAIKDIQGKLKQCIIQNQGLMKQLSVLHQLKKI